MKKRISGLIVITLVLFMANTICAAENSPPKVGGVLPEIELLKPNNSADLKYLGLPGGGFLKVNQIKAKVVIIEIFSMYCPYCQAEAPNVNRLYALIEGNHALKDKIKIIGIGIGNSQFETDIFKKKYTIAFPLTPDADYKLHKIMGEVRTPYFIAVKLNGGKSPEVIYSRLGALENNDLFLAQIVKSAGLK
ncbi:MAG: redoxin domain-containing protein [Deltaproteobacteria bacterium]|nr:redoxin domain-containing protein [Deltaproteobacteria bacterium]